MDEFLGRLSSRKFIVSLLGVALIILNRTLGWGLSPEELTMAIGVLTSFIVVEGVRDIREAGFETETEHITGSETVTEKKTLPDPIE